jgi:hypothetical protein
LAGVKGLEPSAFCVTGRRSNQLSYTPVRENDYHSIPRRILKIKEYFQSKSK